MFSFCQWDGWQTECNTAIHSLLPIYLHALNFFLPFFSFYFPFTSSHPQIRIWYSISLKHFLFCLFRLNHSVSYLVCICISIDWKCYRICGRYGNAKWTKERKMDENSHTIFNRYGKLNKWVFIKLALQPTANN